MAAFDTNAFWYRFAGKNDVNGTMYKNVNTNVATRMVNNKEVVGFVVKCLPIQMNREF